MCEWIGVNKWISLRSKMINSRFILSVKKLGFLKIWK